MFQQRPDNAYERAAGNIVLDAPPASVMIRRLVDVRVEIVQHVAGHGQVGGALAVRRTFDGIDHAFAAVRRRDIFPVLASIDGLHERHVNHPDGIRVHRARFYVSVGPGAAVQHTVRAHLFPGLAAVARAVHAALFIM